MDAYLDGLEQAHAAGRDLARIASVASFFVSRVDTEVDARLDKIGGDGVQAGRPLAVQIGDHRVADRWTHLGQPFGERHRPARAGQLVDDPEMEQHPLSVADRRQVVVVALPGALVPVIAGRDERVQVGDP
jgi:transaldolase